MKPWMIYAAITLVALSLGFGLAKFLENRKARKVAGPVSPENQPI